jgi:solute carrier family 32 (vesicular inhibitory amino acid transporter)
MFGDGVRDEITSNILKTTGYPRALTAFMCIFIAIIPLTKIPLNARPIVNMLEVITGTHQPLQQQRADLTSTAFGSTYHSFMKVFVRIATLLSFLVVSILFPAFDSIMAFMGSTLCFTICIM